MDVFAVRRQQCYSSAIAECTTGEHAELRGDGAYHPADSTPPASLVTGVRGNAGASRDGWRSAGARRMAGATHVRVR